MTSATRNTPLLPSPKRMLWQAVQDRSLFWWLRLGMVLGISGLAVGVIAQIEGTDRGVKPVDTVGTYEVSGVAVDVSGDSAEQARLSGWREAQRKGWQALYTKIHGGGTAPGVSDGQLDSLVGAIVVEDEQVSAHRYIAHLGVVFDRVRSSQALGVSGAGLHSPPLLVIPIVWSGGAGQVFETRTEWQKAWARFHAGNSAINYVRASGMGVDPLLINAAQADRRNRVWWRQLLDKYDAADVIIPQVRLEHLWPGGPIIGHFTARYGPENKILAAFDLRSDSSAALPKMMDDGVRQMDALYTEALKNGTLRSDTSLVIETPVVAEETDTNANAASALQNQVAAEPDKTINHFVVQAVTHDGASVSAIESMVRSTAGVKSASMSSIAIGGTSVMSVAYAGDLSALRAALSGRGYSVEEGGGALRISGGHTAEPAAKPDVAAPRNSEK